MLSQGYGHDIVPGAAHRRLIMAERQTGFFLMLTNVPPSDPEVADNSDHHQSPQYSHNPQVKFGLSWLDKAAQSV
jgi:hypothetical protein